MSAERQAPSVTEMAEFDRDWKYAEEEQRKREQDAYLRKLERRMSSMSAKKKRKETQPPVQWDEAPESEDYDLYTDELPLLEEDEEQLKSLRARERPSCCRWVCIVLFRFVSLGRRNPS